MNYVTIQQDMEDRIVLLITVMDAELHLAIQTGCVPVLEILIRLRNALLVFRISQEQIVINVYPDVLVQVVPILHLVNILDIQMKTIQQR